jgi:hypothetical protein
MARAWPLQRGFELVAHNAVKGLIRDFYAALLAQPLLHFQIARKAARGREAGFELLEYRGRQRFLARRRAGLF